MIRPAGRLLLSAIAAAIAGVAVMTGVLAWALAAGPVSLAFLAPYVQDVLARAELDFQVEFDDVVLTWAGWDRRLDVRVVDVRVYRQDGVAVATLPQVSVALSARAILQGKLALTAIDIFGIRARLWRRADRRLDFGISDDIGPDSRFGPQLVEELLKAPDPDRPLGYLRRVSVLDANLVLYDEDLEISWRAPRADIVLKRDQAGIRGYAEVDAAVGTVEMRLTAEGVYDNREQRADLDIRFTDIVPAEVAAVAPEFSDLGVVDAPVGGSVRLALDAEGRNSDILFNLAAGAGHIALPDLYDYPVPVDGMAAEGRLAADFRVVTLEQARLDLDGATIRVKGAIATTREGEGAAIDGTVTDLTVPELLKYWPTQVAKNARAWLLTHLHDGTISSARFTAALPGAAGDKDPLADDAVFVELAYSDLSVSYLTGFPAITRARGTATVTAVRLDLAMDSAETAGLAVSEGTLAMTGLNDQHQRAEIEAVVSGSVRDSMALLDREPLRYAQAINVEPRSLGGMAATRLKLEFPVKKALAFSEIRFSAAANLRDAAIPGVWAAYNLSQGDLAVSTDGGALEVAGRARLNGVPVEVVWRRSLRGADGGETRIGLSGVLGDAERAALAVPLGDYLSGPVATRLEIFPGANGETRMNGEIGLRDAAVRVPTLSWQKPTGVDGVLRLSAWTSSDGGLRFDSFAVEAGDLTAAGQAWFDAQWRIQVLRFDSLAFGGPSGNDVAGAVRADGAGGYSLEVQGERFDLRPYLENVGGEEDEAGRPPLAISARLKTLVIGDETVLNEVTSNGRHDGQRWQSMHLVGRLNGKDPVELAMTPSGGKRQLRLVSGNAGAVFEALDVFENAEGGTLEARAVFHDDQPGRPVSGALTVSRFRVARAPVLAKILTVGSLTGINDLMNGEGITFTEFVVPFELAGDMLTVKDARAHGPALGITVDGTIDRAQDVAELKGTLVPAYTVNSLLGKIPVLGNILVGGEGEGVFALTYSVAGPVEAPRITVNPLSALAPGFLRHIFSIGAPREGLPEPGTPDEDLR